jgi:hypothetical protein
MTLEQMIEVLQAAQRGEPIQHRRKDRDKWGVPVYLSDGYRYDFKTFDYRIAPKKELSLVEELRMATAWSRDLAIRAADRIEELEAMLQHNCLNELTTDELLAEIKRRMGS